MRVAGEAATRARYGDFPTAWRSTATSAPGGSVRTSRMAAVKETVRRYAIRSRDARGASVAPGAVREEPIVVATCARRARRDVSHAGGAGVTSDERAQIDGSRATRVLASELSMHLRADFVTAPADSGTKMQADLGSGISAMGQ